VPADAAIGLFRHANTNFRLRPLDDVFSAAHVHRWRHSRSRSEADRNFGDSFSFWNLAL
jgi:sterol desaturase/sphingolipid hydroxylase (fatty acid hydroxylase superfamily)